MEQADTFYDVATLDVLTEGEGKLVYAGVKKLALFLYDGNVYCIQNFCPHAGGMLAMGPVEGCRVRCPRHNWAFDFITGECPTDPRYDVKRYPVEINDDGTIRVGLPEDAFL